MSEIAELERRITAALERIGHGVDGLAVRAVAPVAVSLDDGANDALAAERDSALAAAAEAAARATELQAAVDQLTRQIDGYGLDLQRMRKTVIQLRETLRSLRESQMSNATDTEALNAAMAVELESLRLERQADMAEMEAILAALKPLTAEMQDA